VTNPTRIHPRRVEKEAERERERKREREREREASIIRRGFIHKRGRVVLIRVYVSNIRAPRDPSAQGLYSKRA